MNATAPERVRFAPASTLARIVAIAVDVILSTCAMLITLMLVARRGLPQIQEMLRDEPEALALPVLASMLVAASLPFLFAISVSRQGATPGKALMSLSVRDAVTGRFPAYPRAVGRETLRFLHVPILVLFSELNFVGVALAVLVVFDMSRSRLLQTWYDRALKTVIVAPVVEKE